jgi:hypothetical protein
MTFITVLLSIAIVAVVMLFLGIGVMFRGRCLRGTCGGEGLIGPDGEVLTCDTCPRRKELEDELNRLKEADAIHEHADDEEVSEPTMTAR